MTRIRLGIVGCGAVTRRYYLPLAKEIPQFSITSVVDTNQKRAQKLADEFKIRFPLKEIKELPNYADAAVVATPHHLHSKMAVFLLRKGVHVLVEKPAAISLEGCHSMIRAATNARRALAVAMVRRLYPGNRALKSVLDLVDLTRIEKIDISEGRTYSWPVESEFFFNKKMAGGGVLMDTGSHVLDLLHWWFGSFTVERYQDDALGGVEADCSLEVKFDTGARGLVSLSRIRELRNSVRIHFDNSTFFEIGTDFPGKLSTSSVSSSLPISPGVDGADSGHLTFSDTFAEQLRNFSTLISEGSCPEAVLVPEVVMSISRIIECYRMRSDLSLPWVQPDKRGGYNAT